MPLHGASLPALRPGSVWPLFLRQGFIYCLAMMWVSLISFLVAASVVLETFLRKSDFFSPARLYLFFHSVTLGVAFLGFHPAMEAFEPLTSLVYFGSAACYLIGTQIPGLIAGSPRASKSTPIYRSPYNWNLHFVFSSILFLVFLLGWLVGYSVTGELPIFADNTGRAIKRIFSLPPHWALIAINFGGLAAALYLMSLYRVGVRSKWLSPALWMAVASLCVYATLLSRSGLLLFVVFSVVYFHHAVRKISWRRVTTILAVTGVLFMSTAYLKLGEYQKKYGFDVEPLEAVGVILNIPYLYVANNFWNLDYAIGAEDHAPKHPRTYGYTTLSGFFGAMSFPGGNIGEELRVGGGYDTPFQERATKIKGLNTIGYQWGLYKDFGVPGTLIIPLLFGMAFGGLYNRMKRFPTVFIIAVYSYIAFFVTFSWFLAFWESVVFVCGFIYLCACCYLCQYSVGTRHAGETG